MLFRSELQRSTPSGRLGRTLGLIHTLAAGWVMAGSVVMGALAQSLGLGAAILVCAAAMAVLGGAALVRRSHPAGARSAAPVPTFG